MSLTSVTWQKKMCNIRWGMSALLKDITRPSTEKHLSPEFTSTAEMLELDRLDLDEVLQEWKTPTSSFRRDILVN